MTDFHSDSPAKANILWFRHGLRLHDNPALLEALSGQDNGIALLPIFIFDGESAGTKCVGYNRMRFLLESLSDIDQQLQQLSDGRGRLYIFQGDPCSIFRSINDHVCIQKICFEQDCEPIWSKRDSAVKALCTELGIEAVEKVSHTLWDPRLVIKTNGGIPPLTYQMFLHTVQVIGPPPRPERDADWRNVCFVKLPNELLLQWKTFRQFPKPEDLNVFEEKLSYKTSNSNWKGGEQQALLLLEQRLQVEESAFKSANYLPNQSNPNILSPSTSMSPHLRFGCLSVRRFYWSMHDLFSNVQLESSNGFYMAGGAAHITGQLIWREYFYTMSVNNPYYDRIENNEICLKIPWAQCDPDQLHRWKTGKTGFPFIDAAMRQLLAEGWLHHTLRNAVATFLTRGGLWQSWELGLAHFLKYLLDADWSVCAGNWMWISSSAFEQLLDSSTVTCPVALAKRLDPRGEFVRKYVTELKAVPMQYIHEPWRMPSNIQKDIDCIVGVHYPERMIDFEAASKRNVLAIRALRQTLIDNGAPDDGPSHCRPSNDEEIRHFFWLAE